MLRATRSMASTTLDTRQNNHGMMNDGLLIEAFGSSIKWYECGTTEMQYIGDMK